MKIFEFHFNPPNEQDILAGKAKLIFDTFCFEPSNIYEKRLGNLYIAGELKNVLPQNLKFLDKLAEIIKKEYYSQFRQSPEDALRESLKKANEHLEKIVKSGDVSWLGNLNFVILAVSFQKTFWQLNLAKTGNIKILLVRGNKITDISKNIKIQDLEPYPLKIFVNLVSGKLSPIDKILVFSSEIYEFFKSRGLIKELGKIDSFDEKTLKEVLKFGEKEVSQLSGLCLFSDLSLPQKEEKGKKPIILKKEKEKFSWREVFSPVFKFFKTIVVFLKKIIKFKKPSLDIISKPKRKINFLKVLSQKTRFLITHKNTILILIFIAVLLLGTFIFQKEKDTQFKKIAAKLDVIEQKVKTTEGLMVLQETNQEAKKKARDILKEALNEISPLLKTESPSKNRANSLKNDIDNRLSILYNLEKITEPDLFFDFEQQNFVPQKFIYFKGNLYFFSPFSDKIFKVSTNGKSEIIENNQKFNLATNYEEGILFFSKPNKITLFENNSLKETFELKEPYNEYNFNDFCSYKGNIYFLDSQKGEIIQYPGPLKSGFNQPKLWLVQNTEKLKEPFSFSADGKIWVLEKGNKIKIYFAGKFEKILELDIFPFPKNISQIFTSSTFPYLYLLEPSQSRIIIIDKNGKIIKQFKSDKFDNLKDFAVSGNGKTIWLLNGLKVYQVKF